MANSGVLRFTAGLRHVLTPGARARIERTRASEAATAALLGKVAQARSAGGSTQHVQQVVTAVVGDGFAAHCELVEWSPTSGTGDRWSSTGERHADGVQPGPPGRHDVLVRHGDVPVAFLRVLPAPARSGPWDALADALAGLLGHARSVSLSESARAAEAAGWSRDARPALARDPAADVDPTTVLTVDVTLDLPSRFDAVTPAGAGALGLGAMGLGASLRRDLPGDALTLDIAGEVENRRYPPAVEAAVRSICAEAVANARKHAPGSDVRVTLRSSYRGLDVLVSDDGPGLDAPHPPQAFRKLRERARAACATLDVESSRAAGTTVRVSIPW